MDHRRPANPSAPLASVEELTRRRRAVLRAAQLLNVCWVLPALVLVLAVARYLLQLELGLDDQRVAGEAPPRAAVAGAIGLPAAAVTFASLVGWVAGRVVADALARAESLGNVSAWLLGGTASLAAGAVAAAVLIFLCVL